MSASSSAYDYSTNIEEFEFGETDNLWKLRANVIVGWLKQIFKFFSSHLGLLALVVVYAIIGALIFVQLEQPNERQSCFTNSDNFYSIQAAMVDRLWAVSRAYTQASDYDDATVAFYKLLGEFKDAVSTFV